MSTLIVIPARLASSRLPEKLLQEVGGKTVLHHTHDRAMQSRVAGGVVVAVDHQRLADEVNRFGGKWVMTSEDCVSGTDRIAEVAEAMPEVDVFINVQGDEPEIVPATIDAVGQLLIADSQADMATVGVPLRDVDSLTDPNAVKIVMGENHRAITFSRAPIPFVREGISDKLLNAEPPIFWHHVGLYAYRRHFLSWFSAQSPSQLETIEKLEQLRAIEAGKRIVVARIESCTSGIDTSADLDAFRQRIAGL